MESPSAGGSPADWLTITRDRAKCRRLAALWRSVHTALGKADQHINRRDAAKAKLVSGSLKPDLAAAIMTAEKAKAKERIDEAKRLRAELYAELEDIEPDDGDDSE